MTIQSKPSNDLFLKNYDATFRSKVTRCRCRNKTCEGYEINIESREIIDVCYCVAYHGEADEP